MAVTGLIFALGASCMIYQGIWAFEGKFVSAFYVIYELFFTLSLLIDCFVLVFALVRMRTMVKKIENVSLNVTFMVLHLALLFLLLLESIDLNMLNFGVKIKQWFIASELGLFGQFTSFSFMAFIMIKVSKNDFQTQTSEQQINLTFSEEERGYAPSESFDDVINLISERDSFAAKTITNFVTPSFHEKRDTFVN